MKTGAPSLFPLAALLSFSGPLLAQHTLENETNPMAGNLPAITAGKRLYDSACQSCHGADAHGDRAPALAGGVFRHGDADGQLFLNIRNGVTGTQMPAFSQFTSDQVWQLVSYIRSLAGTLVVSERVGGNSAAGKAVFEGKGQCLSCHQVNGRGLPVGPDLSAVGSGSAQSLQAAILNPNQPAATAGGGRGGGRGAFRRGPPATVIVRTADGHEYRGVRKSEDVFSLQMVDTAGQLHLFDKTTLAELRIENQSLMPADYARRLTPPELQDLVAYLKTLTARAPSQPLEISIPGGLTSERIANSQAEPQNWLSYWGDVQGRHYSSLSQIDTSNVRQLQARWAVPMPGNGIVEAVPLVVDGVMYTTGAPGQVFALDARTGRQVWRYQRTQKVVNPYESNRVNRGVAVLGNRVFAGTLDGALIALDLRTGALLWELQVADTLQGYSITSAPLVVKDKIVTGVAGGEYGIRGFVDAYDPASGNRLWRFYTIPGPGEFGHDTWEGDSWKEGSGATWLTGTFDPELNTLFWPVGNPGPDINGDVRKGDNLFTCSVLALDPDTGQRKWHYQFTPNDTHDWDATEDMVLVDRMYRGQNRKLILHADRNGVFYVLDRTNGKLLSATPFVRTTWVDHWDSNGRPVTKPGWQSSPEGSTVFPALGGGTNFQAPSFSPQTGWLYLAYHDGGGRYASGPAPYEAGRQFWGRGTGGGPPSATLDTQGVAAIDPETGKVQWRYEITQNSLSAGVLATAGGIVFAASREGNFIALDSRTGKPLWHFQAGNEIASSPISYAVDGKQYVAISSAGVLFSFALPD
jgi:PQQ-dependent dehydrogenase (methanol/ethanol family)